MEIQRLFFMENDGNWLASPEMQMSGHFAGTLAFPETVSCPGMKASLSRLTSLIVRAHSAKINGIRTSAPIKYAFPVTIYCIGHSVTARVAGMPLIILIIVLIILFGGGGYYMGPGLGYYGGGGLTLVLVLVLVYLLLNRGRGRV
jgi:hypothetical protein